MRNPKCHKFLNYFMRLNCINYFVFCDILQTDNKLTMVMNVECLCLK